MPHRAASIQLESPFRLPLPPASTPPGDGRRLAKTLAAFNLKHEARFLLHTTSWDVLRPAHGAPHAASAFLTFVIEQHALAFEIDDKA